MCCGVTVSADFSAVEVRAHGELGVTSDAHMWASDSSFARGGTPVVSYGPHSSANANLVERSTEVVIARGWSSGYTLPIQALVVPAGLMVDTFCLTLGGKPEIISETGSWTGGQRFWPL